MNAKKARALTQQLAKFAKDMGIQYQYALTTYLIQQLLLRLAKDEKLSRYLTYKGGFIMLRLYDSPRYTIDLDASLNGIQLSEVSSLIVQVAEQEENDGTWYKYEKTIDLQTQGEYGGMRFVFRGGVGAVLENISRAQIINLDLGVGDAVSRVSRDVPLLLSDESCRCSVYTGEVIMAEKLHSLITRSVGNSRSKDIFDIAHLAEIISVEELRKALKETFRARRDPLPADLNNHFESMDMSVLRRGWNSAVVSIAESRTFDDALADVLRLIKRV